MNAPRSRRDEYSEATRRALLDSAAQLFAEKGFSATSLDEVAAHARVTKGAVYHHFANKQALFQAVAEAAEIDACDAILVAAAAAPDAWRAVVAGLDCFLDRCLDPVYLRLCFQEGPTVIGFTAWWEFCEKHEIGLIRGMLEALEADGLVDYRDLETLTHLLFGAMTAAALAMARSDDPEAESRRVRDATLRVLAGLRPADAPPPPAIRRPAKRRQARKG